MYAVQPGAMTREERVAEDALCDAWSAVRRAKASCEAAGADGDAVVRGLADAERGLDEALCALRGIHVF